MSGPTGAKLDDPDGRMPFDRDLALMRASKELTGDPALALHHGERVDMSEVCAHPDAALRPLGD